MQQRVYSIDYMRLLLASFVVIGHSGMGRETFGAFGLIAISPVLRAAVPLFAITAGFFLFRTRLRGKYWIWVKRIATLYVLWYAIYFVFMGLWNQSFGQNCRELILGFRHLWFLEGLVVAAIMMHFAIIRGPRFMMQSAILVAAAAIVVEYASVTHLLSMPLEFYRNGVFFLYPFMVMGYLFALERWSPEALPWPMPRRKFWIWVAIGGFILAVAENAVFLTVINQWALLEYQIGMFFMAPAIFAIVGTIDAPETDLPLGTMASAIYVMHYLFLHFANMVNPGHPLPGALVAFIVPALLVMAMIRLGRGQRWMAQLF
ncbi:acyltransferase family protein [Paracoccus sp. Z330]|uniref:Acyltransferase family protein n=1 Tax=Paracoccus onchidii TaxID=3017813 RepID=A0ABT4ZGR1_9RHOB|nr:acyltransferase family protein [Paracoccus onchidii]MDB6178559.1 acyltransferase family protein [Paracoccus onchidii]